MTCLLSKGPALWVDTMTMNTSPNQTRSNRCPLTGKAQNYGFTLKLEGMTAKELHLVKEGILKVLEGIGSDDIKCRMTAFNINAK